LGTISINTSWAEIERTYMLRAKTLAMDWNVGSGCLFGFLWIYKRSEDGNNGGCDDIKPFASPPAKKHYLRLADLAMGVISKTGRSSPCDCLLSDPSTMQRGRGSPAALAGLIRCTEYPRRGDSFVGKSGKVAAREHQISTSNLMGTMVLGLAPSLSSIADKPISQGLG
jgi:hypothetical protein